MKNSIKIILLFSMTLGYSQIPAKQPVVKSVDIYGAEKASVADVKTWLNLDKNKLFRSEDLHTQCSSLLRGYAKIGLPYARIDSLLYAISSDSSSVAVQIYLNEGAQMSTGGIQFTGMSDEESRLLQDRFNSKPGKLVDVPRLEQDLGDALNFYEKKSFPFIKFDVDGIQIDTTSATNGRFNYRFKMIKGPQLIIKEIQIIGNEVTQKKVILREIRIKEGEFYNYYRVSRIQSRLMKLGYFYRVEPPQVFLATEQEGGLLLRVQEGNSSRFDGVVGYSPGTGEEKGYFTGLIDISLGNLFGSGRSLMAHWQKRDRASQDLMFRYREPWIAGYPVHLGFGFQQLIQDSTYIQRDYGLDAELPLLDNFSVLGSIKNNSILPDSMGSYFLGIPKSKTVVLGIGLVYDSRDDLLNPQHGIYYSTSVESGQKSNLGPEEIFQQYSFDKKVSNKRYFIDMDLFLSTFRRQLISFSIHGRQMLSSEKFIPLPDQFRLGGTKSLRGYREDQFRGSVVAWTNTEYRYILGSRSRAFVFCDVGYYFNETAAGKNESLKIGYGFGVRLETALGIMGIDYGLAYGEKQGLMSGLLHVGVVNEF